MDNDGELRKGAIAGVSAYLLWGVLTLYWKELDHFRAFELIGWRVMSSAVILTVLLVRGRRWSRMFAVRRDRALLARVALAAVLLTTNWTSYVWAVVHDHVIETALGYFMAPIGTIAIGVVVFHEHLRAAQRVAMLLASVAVVVLTVSYGRVPILALLIAVSWSLYGWLKKQVPLTPLESMSAETFVLLVPAVVLSLALSGSSDSVPRSATGAELALLAMSGVATVIPLMLFARAAPRVPLTLLGPMQYSVPIINFLFGWLLYDEALPLSRIVGFGLIWASLVLVTVDTVRRSRAARSVTLTVVDHPSTGADRATMVHEPTAAARPELPGGTP